MDTTVADRLVGELLDGRYRVEQLLARGGMATVYRALDVRLDREVALKVMHPAFADDADFVARFTREARSAARLSHPDVVAVYDQGQDGGVVFLAMEYVAGRTLRDLLHERGRLGPREALDLLQPVLAALAAAHAAGIVHRDVKPENVLLAADGRVKVADFGLARAADAPATGSTRTMLMGTMAYLAPELLERGVADPRADVYAAGILLYEMLVGSPPYVGETPLAVAYQHVNEQVPAPSESVPGLSADVDALVLTATARDAARRPADAAAYLDEVSRVRRSLPDGHPVGEPADPHATLVVPRPGIAPVTPPPAPAAVAASTVPGTSPVVPAPQPAADQPPALPPTSGKRRRRFRGPVVVLVVVALAAASGALAWWLGSGRYTQTPGLVGLTAQQATAKLQHEGLEAAAGTPRFSETVPRGSVVATDPGPGQQVARGGTVTLFLSKGPERYAVPTLAGMTLDQARAALTGTKLAVGRVTKDYSTTVAEGKVISSDPPAGQKVRPSTAVRLVVSKGIPPVPVPNLRGVAYDDASKQLEALGLTLQKSATQNSMTVAKDGIISQSPAAGVAVAKGSTVSVVVSLGPPLVEVPNVRGQSEKRATQILEKAGFRVDPYKAVAVVLLDIVYTQSPGAGEMAPKGSTVRIGLV